MNTREVLNKFKRRLIHDAVESGLIGFVEGFAFTGAVGGLVAHQIFGTDALETILIAAAGIGVLGSLEGIGLSIAAMYGKFGITGDYEAMRQKGFPYIHDDEVRFENEKDFSIFLKTWAGYSLNHVLLGGLACIAYKMMCSEITWSYVAKQIAAISVGTTATGWLVMPPVTAATARMLTNTYRLTHESNEAKAVQLNSESSSETVRILR